MVNNPLPRLEVDSDVRARLLPFCRLAPGKVWEDRERGHRVGCIDASDRDEVVGLLDGARPSLAIHDPPYNVAAFASRKVGEYVDWCRNWISTTAAVLQDDASLYIWLGADQNNGFQPFPDFILMMRQQPFHSRSFITMRNQRGYGTQRNWMAIRQELLYYVKGNPVFNIDAEYTDIPKSLKGYYKSVNGQVTENTERGKSPTIRAGNVWMDVQQVFYRMQENVSGCYAQKPLKSIERIIRASSDEKDRVLDLFAHSGATLLAAELLNRTCITADIDPVFCEITIRRLEQFRRTGRLGWQNGHAFQEELEDRVSPPGNTVSPTKPEAEPMLF